MYLCYNYGWQRLVRILRLLGSYMVSTMQEKHGEPLEMNVVPGTSESAHSTCEYTRVQLECRRDYLSKECAARQER